MKVFKSIALMAAAMLVFQAHALNTQDAATKLGAAEYKEVTFDKNMTNLSDSQKEELRSVVTTAASRGTIDHIKVMAWSDIDYPAQAMNQTKGEVNLTQDRLGYLKSFIRSDLKVANIETYNMTDRPDAIDRLVSSSSPAGSISTDVYDDRAQASKGVIIIFMKK